MGLQKSIASLLKSLRAVAPLLEASKLAQLQQKISLLRQHISVEKSPEETVVISPVTQNFQEIGVSDTPLHRAIQAGNVAEVRRLLEQDTPVEADTLVLVQRMRAHLAPLVANQIAAWIEVYGEIQQGLSTDFPLGKTISLIKQNMASLSIQYNLKHGVLVAGPSGSGKSTMTNWWYGVDYIPAEDASGEIDLEVVSGVEQTKRGTELESETLFPQLVHIPKEGATIADMPGDYDSRGFPWKVIGGISAHLLSRSFETIRMIVMLCTEAQLYDARLLGVRDTLIQVGKLIHEDPDLIPHVILVVNKAKKGAKQIESRLTYILNHSNLPEETRFLLRHLSQAQILLIDVPTDALRRDFWQRFRQLNSLSVGKFHFASFPPEVETFKHLLQHVLRYQEKTNEELQTIQTFLARSAHAALETEWRILEQHNFSEPSNTQLHLQADLKRNITTLYQEILNSISSMASRPLKSTLLTSTDVQSELRKYAARAEVIGNFVEQIAPVIDVLNDHAEGNDLSSHIVTPPEENEKTLGTCKISAATRSVSMPFFMLPLHILSPVITTSFSGIKTLSNSFLNFVKTSWEQSSNDPHTSSSAGTSQETPPLHSSDTTKNNTGKNTHQQKPNDPPKRQKLYMDSSLFRLRPVSPTVNAFELAQVAIPLTNKACERHGFFGHKPLTTNQIAPYRAHYEGQLQIMEASLNGMLDHPILRHRKEIDLAKGAISQARSRFKNTFKNTPHPKITQSQQADISHLVDIAHENLQLAKALQEKIEQAGPALVEVMIGSEKALKKSQERLHEIRVSFEENMRLIDHEQRTLNKKFRQKKITELELKYREMELETNMLDVQKNYEKFETIESTLDFLITKIRRGLDMGQFEQLDALQTNLALITDVTEYMAAKSVLIEEDHAIVRRVFESAEKLRGNEVVETDFGSLRQSVSQSNYPQAGWIHFWASASNHEVQGPTPHCAALPASVQ